MIEKHRNTIPIVEGSAEPLVTEGVGAAGAGLEMPLMEVGKSREVEAESEEDAPVRGEVVQLLLHDEMPTPHHIRPSRIFRFETNIPFHVPALTEVSALQSHTLHPLYHLTLVFLCESITHLDFKCDNGHSRKRSQHTGHCSSRGSRHRHRSLDTLVLPVFPLPPPPPRPLHGL